MIITLWRQPLFKLFLIALPTYWLLILNDGSYYDGMGLRVWRETQTFDFFDKWFWDVGKPILTFIYWPVLKSQYWVILTKLINFFSLVATAFLFFRILKSSRLFENREAFFISALTLTYSGVQMAAENAALQYILLFPVYLLGFHFYQLSFTAQGGKKAALKFAAASFTFLGFFTHSLLLLHYLFLFLILVPQRIQHPKISLVKTVLQLSDAVLWPLVYWVFRNLFFPPQGIYKDYYKLDFTFDGLMQGIVSLVKFPIYSELKNSFLISPNYFVSILFFAAATYLFWNLQKASIDIPQKKVKFLGVAFIGGVGLVLSAIPYILVRQYFEQFGWSTKNHVLFGCVLALTIYGVVGLLTNWLKLSNLRFPLMSTIILLFCINSNKNYLDLQFSSIKDSAVHFHLGNSKVAKESSVFQICDEYFVPRLPDLYYTHISSFIFYMAFRDMKRTGIVISNPSQANYLDSDSVKNIIKGHAEILATPEVDANGNQALVRILPGIDQKLWISTFEYYRLKFFEPQLLPQFYQKILKLEVVELSL